MVSVVLSFNTLNAAAADNWHGNWAEPYYNAIIKYDWANIFENTSPDDTLKKADFLVTLQKAAGCVPGSEIANFQKEVREYPVVFEEDIFRDLDNHWIKTEGWLDAAINWGIIKTRDYGGKNYETLNYPDNNFIPDEPVTRKECFVWILRALGMTGATSSSYMPSGTLLPYSDCSDASGPLINHFYVSDQLGQIEGYPDGTLKYNNIATNAEMAALLDRMLRVMHKGEDAAVKVCLKGAGQADTGYRELALNRPALIDNGFVYAPVRNIYETAYNDIYSHGRLQFRWQSEHIEALGFQYGNGKGMSCRMGVARYGLEGHMGVYDEMFLDAPWKLVNGEAMLPISIQAGSEPLYKLKTDSWDASAKKLYLSISAP